MRLIELYIAPPPHILAELLKVSHRMLPAAIRVGLVLGLTISWLYYPVAPKPMLFSWLGCLIGFSLLRYLSLRHIASNDFKDSEAHQYTRRYTVTAFLLGSTWASLAFLLPYVSAEERVLIFVLLISIAGGALNSMTGHFISYYCYALPIVITLILHAFFLPGMVWQLLGILGIVYSLYMTVAAWRMHNNLKENIVLRYDAQASNEALEKTKQELSAELANRKAADKQLQSVMHELEQAVTHLEQLAAIDELTGIPNRRSFDAAIAREWNRARREQTSIALLMIDVDFFKNYNDLYLHQQGDEALKKVAQALRQFAQRPGDTAARYGGEEFALILVDPTVDYLSKTAEKLRVHIQGLEIKHEASSAADFLTVSIGTAMSQAPNNDDYSALISAADKALYEAKQAGRNQVKTA